MPSRPRIGGHRVLTGWAMLVYAFLYAPIVVVVIFAFNSNQHVTVWDGFTTHWFGDAWNNPVYRSALTTSLRIALASSIIATSSHRGRTRAEPHASPLARAVRRPRLSHARGAGDRDRRRVADLLRALPRARVGLPPARPDDDPLRAHRLQHVARDTDRTGALRRDGIGPRRGRASISAPGRCRRSARSRCRASTRPCSQQAMLSFVLLRSTTTAVGVHCRRQTQTWPMVVFAAVRFGVTPAINAFATLMLLVTLSVLAVTGLVLRRTRADEPGRGRPHGHARARLSAAQVSGRGRPRGCSRGRARTARTRDPCRPRALR